MIDLIRIKCRTDDHEDEGTDGRGNPNESCHDMTRCQPGLVGLVEKVIDLWAIVEDTHWGRGRQIHS